MIFRIIAAITLVSILAAFAPAALFALFGPLGKQILICFFLVFLLSEGILLFAVLERRAPIFGSISWRGAPGLNRVALTFDDGPNEPYTSQLLDILDANGIKATFFLIGQNCEKYPAAVKRLAAEGHEIGNHTWAHEVLPLKPPSLIEDDIAKTSEVIEKYTGRRPVLFRAPHGWRNPWVNVAARKLGCTPVAWTLGVWDTARPGADVIVQRTLKGVEDGCILLVHDGRGIEDKADASQLVQALPVIIKKLRDRGFRFVTLSQMMESGSR